MKNYDLIIIGAGPAGVSAAKVAVEKGLSVLILERGKDLIKRRDLISGWFGKGLNENFELNDNLLDNKKAISEALRIVKKFSSKPKLGLNLASFFLEKLQKADILYNSEVLKVEQIEQQFLVYTNKNIFKSNYCLISTGKYSVEWLKNLCDSLNLDVTDANTKIGVRVEIPTSKICNIIDGYAEDIRMNSFVGEWEDSNMMSAFGYSTNKESHKTNFMVGISTNKKIDEVIREIKIVNILANDRIKCERVYDYMEGKSLVRHIEIFNNLYNIFESLNILLPSFSTYAIMYIPEIRLNGILSVSPTMATTIPRLYGAGECTTRVSNSIGAIASGIIAAKTILKEIKNG